jgi:hypothetical protein
MTAAAAHVDKASAKQRKMIRIRPMAALLDD